MDGLPQSKHSTYFAVLDALKQDGCPICRLGLRAVSRYLHVLSYEGVNDPGVRAELRSARGFCHRHAWQFADDVHDGLGTAIIYRDLVSSLLRWLHGGQQGASHLLRPARLRHSIRGRAQPRDDPLVRHLLPQKGCPACRCLTTSSRRYMETLLLHLDGPELRERYLASSGLCRPHLGAALPRVYSVEKRQLLVAVFLRQVESRGAGPTSSSTVDAFVEALAGKPGALAVEPAMWSCSDAGPTGVEIGLDAALVGRHLGAPGCPVCGGVGVAVAAWLRESAEGQPAPGSKDLAAGLGLCNAHAWRLAEVAEPTEAGKLYREARLALTELLSKPAPEPEDPTAWRRALALFGMRGLSRAGQELASRLCAAARCPACKFGTMVARRVAVLLLDGAGEAGLEVASPCGVVRCLPHLVLSLRLIEDEHRRQALVASAESRWRALLAELDEYLRKQDYRFHDEPFGAEVDAPWRAVAELAGNR